MGTQKPRLYVTIGYLIDCLQHSFLRPSLIGLTKANPYTGLLGYKTKIFFESERGFTASGVK